MIDVRSSTIEATSPEVATARALFVPVDATAAARRSLDLAIRLGRQSPSVIMLIAVLSDADTRTSIELRQELPSLQREVEATGTTVAIHLLSGSDLVGQIHELIRPAVAGRALVLANPLDLSGPLRELTGELLVNQPCDVYLAALGIGGRRSQRSLIRLVLEKLCHRHAS